MNERTAGTQYKFVFELLDLIDIPVVLVATKCDKGRSRHFEEMMYLAKVRYRFLNVNQFISASDKYSILVHTFKFEIKFCKGYM